MHRRRIFLKITMVPQGQFATKGKRRRVCICNDNRMVLRVLTMDLKFTMEYLNKLNNLIKERAVKLLSIPGHSGRRCNDIADDVPRLRVTQPIMGLYNLKKRKCDKARQLHLSVLIY